MFPNVYKQYKPKLIFCFCFWSFNWTVQSCISFTVSVTVVVCCSVFYASQVSVSQNAPRLSVCSNIKKYDRIYQNTLDFHTSGYYKSWAAEYKFVIKVCFSTSKDLGGGGTGRENHRKLTLAQSGKSLCCLAVWADATKGIGKIQLCLLRNMPCIWIGALSFVCHWEAICSLRRMGCW